MQAAEIAELESILSVKRAEYMEVWKKHKMSGLEEDALECIELWNEMNKLYRKLGSLSDANRKRRVDFDYCAR